jgi:hypothetical protein
MFMRGSGLIGETAGMKRCYLVAVAALFLVMSSTSVRADGHELTQAELQRAVAEGRVLPFSSLLRQIESRMQGGLVDVRIFDEGELYYRVVVRQTDGRLMSAVVNARTGAFLPVDSPRARSIQQAARATTPTRGNQRTDPSRRASPGGSQPPASPGSATSGQSGSAPGQGGSAPGQSGSAPGQGGGSSGQGGSGGGGGNGSGPGASGSAGSPGQGSADAGGSGGGGSQAGQSNAGGQGQGNPQGTGPQGSGAQRGNAPDSPGSQGRGRQE